MKKFTKIFAMMLVVVMVVGMFSTVALAAPAGGDTAGKFQAVVDAGQDTSEATAGLNKLGGTIVGVIQTVGYIVAVVMILIFAVKWMMATPQKKQELKDRMVNLAIGLVLLVGGVTVLGWVTNFAEQAI